MHVIIFRFYAQYIHIEISDKLEGWRLLCCCILLVWFESTGANANLSSRMTPPPKHRARKLTELSDEYENDVNHMLCSSHSPHLKSHEHRWETYFSSMLVLSTTFIKTEETSFERMAFIPPVQFENRQCFFQSSTGQFQ